MRHVRRTRVWCVEMCTIVGLNRGHRFWQSLMTVTVLASVGVMLSALPVQASASRFSDLVIFGDSLSDTGNIFAFTQNRQPFPIPPSGPYFAGRFSNGPNYADDLAAFLGLQATSSLLGGDNFAVGGARTNSHAVPQLSSLFSILAQVQSFVQRPGPADPHALYIVFGGANDLQDAIMAGPVTGPAIAQDAVTNLGTAITALADEGAIDFFVPNAPNLALAPRINGLNDPTISAFATGLTQSFNSSLATELDTLEVSLGINISRFDTFAFFNNIVAHGASFGFSDVHSRCYTGDDLTFLSLGTVCPHPEGFGFWDGVHPTEKAHALLAQAFERVLVPEPSTLTLLSLGLMGGLAYWRRRRDVV
jgi:outer membrane lipase/esterase